jgi:hypothetical protein
VSPAGPFLIRTPTPDGSRPSIRHDRPRRLDSHRSGTDASCASALREIRHSAFSSPRALVTRGSNSATTWARCGRTAQSHGRGSPATHEPRSNLSLSAHPALVCFAAGVLTLWLWAEVADTGARRHHHIGTSPTCSSLGQERWTQRSART